MKRLLSLLISLLILGVIYWKIDLQQLLAVFQRSDRTWMILSLAMVIPITLMTAWRLQQLMPNRKQEGLTFWEANRLILMASVLNMVLPSKMGDIAKAYFMKERGHLDGSLSISLVVFEKICDMLSLLVWCVFGLLLYPAKDGLFWSMTIAVSSGLMVGGLLLGSKPFADRGFTALNRVIPQKMNGKLRKFQQSWQAMHEYFWRDRDHLLRITLISLFLWFLHLLQIWLFILALNAWTPFISSLALSPLAILAGLLPLTFAGVGTRDAALILFYQPFFNAQTAGALGLLCTSRYLMPAIAGLPFLSRSLATVKQIRQSK